MAATDAAGGVLAVRYVGAKGEIPEVRRAFAEAHNVRPQKDVEASEVDVPTDKAGLLAYLNGLVG